MLQKVYEQLYDRKVTYLIQSMTVGLIASFCKTTRAEVYRALNELLKRGLVMIVVHRQREWELVGDEWTDLKASW